MIMFSIKRRIREILAAIASHHAMDTRHPSLGELKGDGKEGDDDGVDVLEITCSNCGGMDTENNDILLCDKKGCCRAYHQKCQSPEVKKAELAAAGDWFCRECETMDRCMAMIAGSKLRDVSKTSLSSEEAACEAAGTAQQWEDEFDPESLQGLVIVHEMMRHASPMQQRSAGRPRKERPPSDDSILASKQHLHLSSPSSPPPLSVNTEKERECMETIDLRVRTVATVGKNGANKNGVVLVFRVKQDMPIQRILEAYAGDNESLY